MKRFNWLLLMTFCVILCTLSIQAEELDEILTVPAGQSHLLKFENVERVAVADPKIGEIVVISQTEVLINGIQEGVTTLHIWTTDGYERMILRVFVDTSFTADQIKQVISNPEIEVIKIKETVILKGTVDTFHGKDEAVQIVESLGYKVMDLIKIRQSLQVLIRAYIAEVNREDIENLGLEWGGLVRGVFQPGQITFGQVNINTLLNQLDLLGFQLKAMEKENLTRILAAPELVAMSGEYAEILIGGEIPVLKDDGVVWKPYGIILAMTPEILEDGQIKLSLEPEVSTVDWDNAIKVGDYKIPAFKTRRIKTKVIVGNGSTIVLGGLIGQNEIKEIQKVPFLGDIPILGEFFQSHNLREGQSELVVLVQTWILNDELMQKVYQEKKPLIEKSIIDIDSSR